MGSEIMNLIKEKSNKKVIWRGSPIEVIYQNDRDRILMNEDIMRRDLTIQFWETIRSDIAFSHNTTILIRGATTSGKSTVGLKIMHEQNNILEEKFKKTINRYESICSDQIEFVRFSNKGETDRCILVDEFSALGMSGFNASTELNSFYTINNIFAQKNILKVYCTPGRSMYDGIANIILDVIGRDDKKKTTTCKLSYNDFSTGQIFGLGFVIISVGDIIEAKWYQKYREKKFARMDLLDKYGVKDIRDLEFSELSIQVFEKLVNLTKNDQRIPHEITLLSVKNVLQSNKLIYSITAETELAQRVRGLLNSKHELEKSKRRLEKYKRELARPMVDYKYAEIEEKIIGLTDVISELESSFNELYESEKKNAIVLKEYRRIKWKKKRKIILVKWFWD